MNRSILFFLPPVFAIVIASALATSTAPSRAAPQATLQVTPQEARTIAAEAYVYFYPLVTMDVTRRQMTNQARSVNAFAHLRAFPDAKFKTVVRSNFDTLYSSAWLDLTKGPMVVSAPDTHGRYYLLPMLDMWTDVFAVPGKRTSGTEPVSFAVVPPGWTGTLPDGVELIRSPTPFVWVVGRTQTNGPADYQAVHKIQDGYRVTPLAQWGKPAREVSFTPDPSVNLKVPPKVQVDSMRPADFFHYAAELAKVNPPHVTDWSQIARLARIGIVPGKSFDMSALDPAIQQAVTEGANNGAKTMIAKMPSIGHVANGWQINTSTMGVYGDDYLKRAIIAQTLLSANQPEDAIYPLNLTDADGKPVVGGVRYVLHFGKANVPPVYAFWSLSMYDTSGFQIANAINRFAIGDRDPLKYNADGSLDLYIQHDNPGLDKESNWLPSPASGVLSMTLRLYAPKPSVLDGSWTPPPVTKINAARVTMSQ